MRINTNDQETNNIIYPEKVENVYSNQWLSIRNQYYQIDGIEKCYTIIDRNHSVVIIPVSPTNHTLLLRQYRFPTEGFSWELPMGGIDENEKPQSAAIRELEEETGIHAKKLINLGCYHAVPGLTPQKVYVFLAKVTDEELNNVHHHQNVDDINAKQIISIDDVYKLAASNDITDGFTLASLLLFKLRR